MHVSGLRVRSKMQGNGTAVAAPVAVRERLPHPLVCGPYFEDIIGVGLLATMINRLKMHSLRAQIETSRLLCGALAGKFELTTSPTEKSKLARRYDEALRQTHTMQLLLELMERQEREAVGQTAVTL